MRKKAMLMACFAGLAAAPLWAHCGKCGTGGKEEAHHEVAKVGHAVPDFELKDTDGKEIKLSDYKGKVVVLEWINHECPVVNRVHGAKLMSSTLAKFKGQPVVWLAIDSSWFANDKVSAIRTWMKERKLEYPILLDAPGAVGHAFGAKTTPHMFVIDQKGVLAYAGAPNNNQYGDDESPRNYVEEAVSALLKGSTVATAKTKSYGCSVKYKK